MRATVAAVMALVVPACGGNTPPSGGPGQVRALSIPGDSLHRLASNQALWPVRQSAERKCEGSFLCYLGFLGRRVNVDIFADTGARNASANPTVRGATLVGKFENTGKSTERTYNLTNGAYDFLLFVFPVSGGAEGRWVVERVDRNPTSGTYQHETVSEGRFKGCNHPNTVWSKSFGQFLTCEMGPPLPPPDVTRAGADTRHAVRTAGFASSFLNAINLLVSAAGDPAWFTCRAGCCVADPM